jgi:hypothetical protein
MHGNGDDAHPFAGAGDIGPFRESAAGIVRDEPGMTDDSARRLKARKALRDGALPDAAPQHMWGGPGFGDICAICREPVQPDELELVFASGGDGLSVELNSHVHVQCFHAWEAEHEALHGSAESNGPGKLPNDVDAAESPGAESSCRAPGAGGGLSRALPKGSISGRERDKDTTGRDST